MDGPNVEQAQKAGSSIFYVPANNVLNYSARRDHMADFVMNIQPVLSRYKLAISSSSAQSRLRTELQ